jgi:hypothetical protein
MAKMDYEKAASRARVRKYGSLNDQPTYMRKHLTIKKPTTHKSIYWTDWFHIKHYWTRELRLTDNDQPWD